MKLKDSLTLLWLIGFVNMVLAEIVTLATPKLTQGFIELAYGPALSLQRLLILIVAIEAAIGAYFIIHLRQRKIGRLSNIVGASITLVFIITIGKTTPGYMIFSIIETICLLSLILICLINNPLESKKSGISFRKS